MHFSLFHTSRVRIRNIRGLHWPHNVATIKPHFHMEHTCNLITHTHTQCVPLQQVETKLKLNVKHFSSVCSFLSQDFRIAAHSFGRWMGILIKLCTVRQIIASKFPGVQHEEEEEKNETVHIKWGKGGETGRQMFGSCHHCVSVWMCQAANAIKYSNAQSINVPKICYTAIWTLALAGWHLSRSCGICTRGIPCEVDGVRKFLLNLENFSAFF